MCKCVCACVYACVCVCVCPRHSTVYSMKKVYCQHDPVWAVHQKRPLAQWDSSWVVPSHRSRCQQQPNFAMTWRDGLNMNPPPENRPHMEPFHGTIQTSLQPKQQQIPPASFVRGRLWVLAFSSMSKPKAVASWIVFASSLKLCRAASDSWRASESLS